MDITRSQHRNLIVSIEQMGSHAGPFAGLPI